MAKNPQNRLGCHPVDGERDVRNHLFFKRINWQKIESRDVQPPFKPHIVRKIDENLFDGSNSFSASFFFYSERSTES